MLASFDFISPPELIAVTTAFLGGEIFLDPASSERANTVVQACLLYTSPSPRDAHESRMPSSA